MNVLVVEDGDTKAEQIMMLVDDILQVESIRAKSVRTAYPALQTMDWDLIILDIILHSAEGQFSSTNKEGLAGIEVFQALCVYPVKTKVIVATQHTEFKSERLYFPSIEALNDALHRAFPKNYVGIVKVSLSEDGWKGRMREMIAGLML